MNTFKSSLSSYWLSILGNRVLSAVLVFAVVLSLVASFKLGHRDMRHSSDFDAKVYTQLATNLLAGKGYQTTDWSPGTPNSGSHMHHTTYWAPGMPLFIAGIYAVAGHRPLAVYLVQSLLLALLLLTVYKIALFITESHTVSNITIIACALFPPFYSYLTVRSRTEFLASLLLALGVYYLLCARKHSKPQTGFIAGIFFGLVTITKAVALPIPLVAAMLISLDQRNGTTRYATAGLLLLGAFITVAPLTITNSLANGKFVPITTGGGMNLWLGNDPSVYEGMWEAGKSPVPAQLRAKLVGKTSAECDAIYMHEAIQTMAAAPVRTAGIFWDKFSSLWLGLIGTNPHWLRQKGVGFAQIGPIAVPYRSFIYVVLLMIAIRGWFVLTPESRRRFLPLTLLLIYWTAAYVAITGDPRYILPIQFYEIMLACVAIERTYKSMQLDRNR